MYQSSSVSTQQPYYVFPSEPQTKASKESATYRHTLSEHRYKLADGVSIDKNDNETEQEYQIKAIGFLLCQYGKITNNEIECDWDCIQLCSELSNALYNLYFSKQNDINHPLAVFTIPCNECTMSASLLGILNQCQTVCAKALSQSLTNEQFKLFSELSYSLTQLKSSLATKHRYSEQRLPIPATFYIQAYPPQAPFEESSNERLTQALIYYQRALQQHKQQYSYLFKEFKKPATDKRLLYQAIQEEKTFITWGQYQFQKIQSVLAARNTVLVQTQGNPIKVQTINHTDTKFKQEATKKEFVDKTLALKNEQDHIQTAASQTRGTKRSQVIVIDDDDEQPSAPPKSKRLKTFNSKKRDEEEIILHKLSQLKKQTNLEQRIRAREEIFEQHEVTNILDDVIRIRCAQDNIDDHQQLLINSLQKYFRLKTIPHLDANFPEDYLSTLSFEKLFKLGEQTSNLLDAYDLYNFARLSNKASDSSHAEGVSKIDKETAKKVTSLKDFYHLIQSYRLEASINMASTLSISSPIAGDCWKQVLDACSEAHQLLNPSTIEQPQESKVKKLDTKSKKRRVKKSAPLKKPKQLLDAHYQCYEKSIEVRKVNRIRIQEYLVDKCLDASLTRHQISTILSLEMKTALNIAYYSLKDYISLIQSEQRAQSSSKPQDATDTSSKQQVYLQPREKKQIFICDLIEKLRQLSILRQESTIEELISTRNFEGEIQPFLATIPEFQGEIPDDTYGMTEMAQTLKCTDEGDIKQQLNSDVFKKLIKDLSTQYDEAWLKPFRVKISGDDTEDTNALRYRVQDPTQFVKICMFDKLLEGGHFKAILTSQQLKEVQVRILDFRAKINDFLTPTPDDATKPKKIKSNRHLKQLDEKRLEEIIIVCNQVIDKLIPMRLETLNKELEHRLASGQLELGHDIQSLKPLAKKRGKRRSSSNTNKLMPNLATV